MVGLVEKRRTRRAGYVLACSVCLFGACGGESAHQGRSPNGTAATGGTLTTTTGGSGGDFVAASGGTTPNGTGGSDANGVGGTAPNGAAGAAADGAGGTKSSGGSGGTSATTGGSGGSAPASDCSKVTCAAIPTSCKKIVQNPGECCPSCPDTGCDKCPDLACDTGTHSETLPGDCCPSCVADPPDPCPIGQMNYVGFRGMLFDKYSSSGCKNSTDCTLLLEDNACAYACNVALPSIEAQNFAPNLLQYALTACATCPPPDRVNCDPQIAACVNGKCVGVDASN
jgi:hypothetical protein